MAAQPDDHLAQRAVVHVEHALPGDAPDVDVELVAVVHVVVDQRGQQVVGRGDRREVAGEVQVDVGHRHDLAVAASGRAALHAEDRAHRRLAEARDGAATQPVQRVGETDGRGGLALPGRGGRQRGHQDEPAQRPVRERRQVAQVDLGLVVAVWHQVRSAMPSVSAATALIGRSVAELAISMSDSTDVTPPSPRVHASPAVPPWSMASGTRLAQAPPLPPGGRESSPAHAKARRVGLLRGPSSSPDGTSGVPPIGVCGSTPTCDEDPGWLVPSRSRHVQPHTGNAAQPPPPRGCLRRPSEWSWHYSTFWFCKDRRVAVGQRRRLARAGGGIEVAEVAFDGASDGRLRRPRRSRAGSRPLCVLGSGAVFDRFHDRVPHGRDSAGPGDGHVPRAGRG